MSTTAFLTDRYELTMVDAAFGDGTAGRRCTFEAYCRHLPSGVERGVAAGITRLVDAIESFRFDPAQLAFLAEQSVVSGGTLAWLSNYRFNGTLTVITEGGRFDAEVPVVTVDGTFAESVVLETLVLSILNSTCTVATHAAAMRRDVGTGASLIEMGSRRTHELGAVDSAYAAYIGGFDATSNLEAGRRYGIPTAGTAAHAWTLLHEEEVDAFVGQMLSHGVGTTLLVDTYDPNLGIANAVRAANILAATGPGAIRLDSGDLLTGSRDARRQLDSLGAETTKIVVSGDLDSSELRRLRSADAPIDAYGVGTRLVAAPPLGFVYKLVAVADQAGAMVPVAKISANDGKSTVGGRKVVTIGVDGTTRASVEPEDSEDIRTVVIKEGRPMTLPIGFRSPVEARRDAMKRTALIVVDLQNDFCEGGSLAVAGGAAVAERLDKFVRANGAGFDLLVSTRDWHGATTADHFAAAGEEPDYATRWPEHCMAGSPGAEYHPAISESIRALPFVEVLKGQTAAAYSGFDGTLKDDPTVSLAELLDRSAVTDIYVAGLATDYCVRATVIDSLSHFEHLGRDGRVVLLADMTAPVDEASGASAVEEMARRGAEIERTMEPVG